MMGVLVTRDARASRSRFPSLVLLLFGLRTGKDGSPRERNVLRAEKPFPCHPQHLRRRRCKHGGEPAGITLPLAAAITCSIPGDCQCRKQFEYSAWCIGATVLWKTTCVAERDVDISPVACNVNDEVFFGRLRRHTVRRVFIEAMVNLASHYSVIQHGTREGASLQLGEFTEAE